MGFVGFVGFAELYRHTTDTRNTPDTRCRWPLLLRLFNQCTLNLTRSSFSQLSLRLKHSYLLPHINRAEIPSPLRPVATPAWISPITPGLSIQNNVPGTQVYPEDCSGWMHNLADQWEVTPTWAISGNIWLQILFGKELKKEKGFGTINSLGIHVDCIFM